MEDELPNVPTQEIDGMLRYLKDNAVFRIDTEHKTVRVFLLGNLRQTSLPEDHPKYKAFMLRRFVVASAVIGALLQSTGFNFMGQEDRNTIF